MTLHIYHPRLTSAFRILCRTFLLTVVVHFSTQAHAAHQKVFLLGGQSNAVGLGKSADLPTGPIDYKSPQNDILFFYSGGPGLTTLRPGSGTTTAEFGPEVSFGRAIADAYPSDNIAIIKHGAAGTALYDDWNPDTGTNYASFRNTVAAGLAAIHAAGHTTEIVGMVWHQGESDAIEGQQANYQSNLTAFIGDIRNRYGSGLPFLIGEIRRSNGPAFVTVADAQIAVSAADPNAEFVPASDLSFFDKYHFDAASQVTLGKRFASSYISLDTGGTNLSLSDISNDRGDGPILVGTSVTYTLTFTKDMVAGTVNRSDFGNAGTASVSWGAISEVSPGVFTLTLTANSTGTIRLQVLQGAELFAEDGERLDTANPISDQRLLTVTESGTGAIEAGTRIGVDFGGTPDANFNGVLGDGTITNLKNTAGDSLAGVNITTSGSLVYNVNADHTKTGQPSQFTQEHLTDWAVFEGATYTITFAGLNDSLTYDLVIGGANDTTLNVNTTWTADGQSATTAAGTTSSTDGSGAFVTFRGLETDGTGKLVVTGTKGTKYGAVAALELTAVASNTFETWIGNPVFGLATENRGFALDPDGDGIANGVEAWFGTNPGAFNSGISIQSVNGFQTTFTHPSNPSPPSDLTITYQWSTNLVDWYDGDGEDGPIGGSTVIITPDDSLPDRTVLSTADSTTPRLFLRVKISRF